MHRTNAVTSSSDRYPIIRWQVTGNPSVTYQPTTETTLADALEQVKKELKSLQDQGRVRLQYAILEGDRFFDVIGRIKDGDHASRYLLYKTCPEWQKVFDPFGWTVRLIVVADSDTFVPFHELKAV